VRSCTSSTPAPTVDATATAAPVFDDDSDDVEIPAKRSKESKRRFAHEPLLPEEVIAAKLLRPRIGPRLWVGERTPRDGRRTRAAMRTGPQ
jgi:hypothetical protein